LGGATPPTSGPLVAVVHDLGFLHFPDYYTRHGRRFLRRGLELIRRDAAILPVGPRAPFDYCVSYGFEPERLRLVPWGVDTPDVAAEDMESARERFSLRGRYVVVVGTLEPRKNLRRLMEAWKLVQHDLHENSDDLALVVIGPDGWG